MPTRTAPSRQGRPGPCFPQGPSDLATIIDSIVSVPESQLTILRDTMLGQRGRRGHPGVLAGGCPGHVVVGPRNPNSLGYSKWGVKLPRSATGPPCRTLGPGRRTHKCSLSERSGRNSGLGVQAGFAPASAEAKSPPSPQPVSETVDVCSEPPSPRYLGILLGARSLRETIPPFLVLLLSSVQAQTPVTFHVTFHVTVAVPWPHRRPPGPSENADDSAGLGLGCPVPPSLPRTSTGVQPLRSCRPMSFRGAVGTTSPGTQARFTACCLLQFQPPGNARLAPRSSQGRLNGFDG